jgi:MoxR-like ATPase
MVEELVDEARQRIGQVVHGQEEAVTSMLVALGARGHVLLEGYPGMGKTTLAKTFARVTGLEFSRIQLTPDLMPTDLTGHMYYDESEGSFEVRHGPVFTNVLLADEINRTPPRTQAALLEVMQEQQVTIEGNRFDMPDPYLVVATKNPIEVEGVYRLPEAQLDRFMLHTQMTYPERDVESAMLDGKLDGTKRPDPMPELAPALQATAAEVDVHEDVRDYLLDIVDATRDHEQLDLGASPRASEHLMNACQALAVIEGRSYVVPDDVKTLAPRVLRHRLMLTADAEVEERTTAQILDGTLDGIEVPIEQDWSS